MHIRYLSVIALVWCTLYFSQPLFSQSSIYQDSKELAEFLQKEQVPVLDFSKIDSITSGLSVFNNVTKETTRYLLPSFGEYPAKIRMGDTLLVTAWDSVVTLTTELPIQKIKIIFTPDHTTIKQGDETVFFQKANFRKMLKILEAHADFSLNGNALGFRPFRKTITKFRNNDFFNSLAIPPALLNQEAEKYFDAFYVGRYDENYINNFSWLKLMYGDSILDHQKKVSFKDANSSYRMPIVTSKNELDDANAQINQKNRQRNFLDARTVAVGLSDFIAERAQEELNLTFFNRFRENLRDTTELTILFPNTKILLEQFEISDYKTLLANARGSFTTDLENLGLHFPDILNLPKYSTLNNSSEVFNLAMIFSVANLAYRDIPVEDILMMSFQKLRDRQVHLTDSIQHRLGKIFINPNTLKTNTLQQEQPYDLEKLKSLLTAHLNAMRDSRYKLNTLTDMMKYEFDDFHIKMEEWAKNSARLDPSFGIVPFETSKWKTELGFKIDQFITSFEAEKNEINEKLNTPKTFSLIKKKIKKEPIDFYRNTVFTNLDGKENYDYFLESPSVREYELFFRNQPDPQHLIIARGLSASRNMVKDFEGDFIDQKLLKINEMAHEARALKVRLLNQLKNDVAFEKQLNDLIKKAQYLIIAIDEEYQFWKNVTKDQTQYLAERDYHLTGLLYLKKILESDRLISMFSTVANGDVDVNFQGEGFAEFYGVLNERVDYVLVSLIDKTDQLVEQFGDIPFDQTLYLQKLDAFRDVTPKFNMLKKIEQIENEFKERRYQVEDSISWIAENEPAWQKLITDLKSFQEQYDATDDEAEKRNLDDKIALLNREQNSMEQQIDGWVQMEVAKITAEKEQQIKALKDSIMSESFALVYPDTPVVYENTLRDFFDIHQNAGMKGCSADLKEGYTISARNAVRNEFLGLDKIDSGVARALAFQQVVDSTRQELVKYMDGMEKYYCPELVKAKENAQSLGKSLEIAIHLFFAFRDYDKATQPLTFQDTTVVTLTNNLTDTGSGLILGTSRKDTLQIMPKEIEETSLGKRSARWITRKQFEELRANDTQWNIFLGLLYQRISNVEGVEKISPDGIALLATQFLNIANDIDNYRTAIRIKKATTPERLSFKDYYPFIRSTVDLFNTVIETQTFGNQSLTKKFKTLRSVPKISHQALSLYENIYVQEYGTAILNAMELLKIIADKKINASEKDQKSSLRTINAVLLYGTFMANMINARTSDQVKNILKSTTLPPGSSRVKRETRRSITINSYLGAAVGRDMLIDAPAMVDKSSFGAALSVPIGFTYSTSPKWIKNNSSISFHIPLLDLGAITAYRQSPSNNAYTVENLPELEWSNLFSPGFFAVYNFANSPFSLGVGGQYGPQLRKIEIGTAEPVFANSWRFPMVFFNIDVPFYNLHTGARKVVID